MSFRRLARACQALASAAVVAGSACTSRVETPPPPKPVLRLAHNPWLAAELNDAIAKILLEEQLGYTVELVPESSSGQFEPLSRGEVHASLEVWPSGHLEDMVRFIDQEHRIENGGPLGVTAKVGWFLPSYTVDAHPDLASWQGLRTPENVALFRTPETGEKGRFLSGDPGWQQWEPQIVKNLGLDFTVVLAGSEEAELAEIDRRYLLRQPVLFYFWFPHWAFGKYDLTMVALPPYSDECWARAATSGIDCDYPTETLTKVFWIGLKSIAPDAHRFLSRFQYPTSTQIQLMASVKLNGMTVEQTARAWIEKNEATWKPWIAP